MSESLIELIYECAFLPELWDKVLDQLAGIADARGGALYFPGPDGLRWKASDGLRGLVADYVDGGWAGRTKRRERISTLKPKGFVSDKQLFSQEDLEQDPIYRDFLWPRGFGWAAAARLPLGREGSAVLSLERDYARGPLERTTLDQLDELHPHLMRSAQIAARLRFERARLTTETLALLGHPALVVDFQGRALAANDLIQEKQNFVRWLATDRIALRDKSADKLLKEALKRLSGNAVVGKHCFPAGGRDGEDRSLVHVIPIAGKARDIFGGSALIMLSPVNPPTAPSLSLIQAMFGLSPREARVAQGLAEGATLDEIAAEAKVSRNTVRSQLRGVLEKTGCNRQAEVVALLSRLTLSADVA